MKWIAVCLVAILLAASGCERKPGVKYDPDRVENDKHPQSAPASVPEAGIQAIKKMKQISKEEEQKVKEDQKVLEESDKQ